MKKLDLVTLALIHNLKSEAEAGNVLEQMIDELLPDIQKIEELVILGEKMNVAPYQKKINTLVLSLCLDRLTSRHADQIPEFAKRRLN